MYLECYEFSTDRENSIYRFSSSGDCQIIEMMVHFQLIGFNYFNISFGVYNYLTGKIDVYTRTRNNDTTKVFSTLARIILDFTTYQHDSIILLIGATKSRNRLFRIIISLYFDFIQDEFKIYGAHNGKWEKFSSNRAYDSFYFRRIR